MSDQITSDLLLSFETEIRNAVGLPSFSDSNRANKIIAKDKESLLRFGAEPPLLASDLGPALNFNVFLAEAHLRDGSALVDRCLQLRRESDDLRARHFEASVQIEEALALNRILRKEEALYSKPSALDRLQAAAEQSIEGGATAASLTLQQAYNELDTNKAEAIRLSGDMAYINKFSGVGMHVPKYGKGNDNYADLLQEQKAQRLTQLDILGKLLALKSQKQAQETPATSAAFRKSALNNSADLKDQQAELQKERNDVAVLVALRRSLALTSGGALNYDEQLRAVQRRLRIDLMNAHLRLLAAFQGLKMLYSYSIAYGTKPDGQPDLDEMAEWCQVANTWLAGFQDQQQVVTHSVSLKSCLKDIEFEKGKERGRWEFEVKPSNLSSRRIVRLRSVALQIDSRKTEGSWNVSLEVPTKGTYTDIAGVEGHLEQGHVGKLYLGRINERRFAVLPELQAAPRLQNCSPIGKWALQIEGSSTLNQGAKSINDVDLHLTVTLI